jgi:hypothetical protein
MSERSPETRYWRSADVDRGDDAIVGHAPASIGRAYGEPTLADKAQGFRGTSGAAEFDLGHPPLQLGPEGDIFVILGAWALPSRDGPALA